MLAMLSGILNYAAGPGVGWSFLAPVAFLPLLSLVINTKSFRRAFLLGALSATTAFGLALWSLPAAAVAHSGIGIGEGWIVLAAVLLLESIPLGVGSAVAVLLGSKSKSWLRSLLTLIGLVAAERFIPTPTRYSQAAILVDTPFLPLVGYFGRSMGSAIVFTSNLLILEITLRHTRWGLITAGLIALPFAFPVGPLTSFYATAPTRTNSLRALVIDTNAPPSEKRHHPKSVLRNHVDLTRTAFRSTSGQVDVVVWGESVLSQPRSEKEQVRLVRKAFEAAPVLFGAVLLVEGSDLTANSVLVTKDCSPNCRYDKQKLVPLTEAHLPWPLGAIIHNRQKWSATAHGRGPDVVKLGETLAGVLICYEGMFESEVDRVTRAGAQVIINLVSDDWLRDPVIRRYHEALARLAAVEHRQIMLRISNRGRTIVQDENGWLLFASRENPEDPVWSDVLVPLRPRGIPSNQMGILH